ncbi:MAG: hypothetical protein LKF52_02450 [Butyrivibrio sp.]|nr:hypothetical protein [Butyrivibrio sp.]
MLKKTFQKYLSLFTVLCLVLLTISGCGTKNDDLETYKTNMNSFFDAVASYNDAINEIDPNSATATQDLLSDLDGMNAEFQKMAAYEIPDEFSSLSNLSTDAASYMSQAVATYHQAYDGAYNKDSADLAAQYYERANSRVQYMISILHGETPSGEGITITTEDTYNFATIPAEDSSAAASAVNTASAVPASSAATAN